jgi:hypothetical protein
LDLALRFDGKIFKTNGLFLKYSKQIGYAARFLSKKDKPGGLPGLLVCDLWFYFIKWRITNAHFSWCS